MNETVLTYGLYLSLARLLRFRSDAELAAEVEHEGGESVCEWRLAVEAQPPGKRHDLDLIDEGRRWSASNTE